MNAQQLSTLASKTENSSLTKFFGYFDSYYKENKLEECAKLYIRAAQAYKMEKNYLEASKMFIKASELYSQLNSSYEQINNLTEAFNLYSVHDIDLAHQCLKTIIDVCTTSGDFTKLITYKYSLSEIYQKMKLYDKAEQELLSIIDACRSTPRSRDYQNKSFNTLFDLYIELENYSAAAKTCEQFVVVNEDNKNMSYKNSEMLFNAAMCKLLCESFSDVEIFLNKHYDGGAISATDKRYQLLIDVITTAQSGDENSFTEVVRGFDSISRLKPWHIKVLLEVKKKYIEGLEPDLC
jgi:alpha-soluble NSF attachment protein